jgi:hypothetical protein
LEVSEYWTSNYTTSHSNKRNIVWAQKQTWRPVEQNRRPRNKTTQLQPSDLWQRSQKHTMEKRQPFQQMMLGKLVIYMQKTELDSYLSSCTKFNTRWFNDFNSDLNPWNSYRENPGKYRQL